MLIYIGIALVGGYFILAGLGTLLSVAVSLLAVPFGLMHDATQYLKKDRPKDRVKRCKEELARKDRELNEYFERKYFPEDNLPKSGSLDANGIPYL